MTGLFPDKLAKVLLSANDLEEAISSYPLKVTGYQSFEQAQVCSGGVDTLRRLTPGPWNPHEIEAYISQENYWTLMGNVAVTICSGPGPAVMLQE